MSSDFIDEEGYPTDEALDRIKGWAHEDFTGLWRFVQELWRYPQFIKKESEPGDMDLWSISTGGWSGNESIIHALKEHHIFWSFCWVSSRRGGHYEFEIRNLPT